MLRARTGRCDIRSVQFLVHAIHDVDDVEVGAWFDMSLRVTAESRQIPPRHVRVGLQSIPIQSSSAASSLRLTLLLLHTDTHLAPIVARISLGGHRPRRRPQWQEISPRPNRRDRSLTEEHRLLYP